MASTYLGPANTQGILNDACAELEFNVTIAHATIDSAMNAVSQHISAVLLHRRTILHSEVTNLAETKRAALSASQGKDEQTFVQIPVLFDESENAINEVCTQLANIGQVGMDVPQLKGYSKMDATYINGRKISPNAPIYDGKCVEFRIEPNVPTGLKFNTSTGVLSGTPQWVDDMQGDEPKEKRQLQRRVVIQNAGGSTDCMLSMTLLKSSEVKMTTSTFLTQHCLSLKDTEWR